MTAQERKKRREEREHQNKLDVFLEQLKSQNDQDVECNAEILAEIIKSFAVTFSLEIQDIVKLINQHGENDLNMEDIRVKLFNLKK